MDIRNIQVFLVAAVIVFITSGCKYRGDGVFESEGMWPFVNYSLVLPEFQFKNGFEAEFSLEGYKSHGRSMLELSINSPDPIPFYQLNAIVELKVSDDLGTTYFYRKGPLNQHYMRMAEQKETSWPLETEWNTKYRYGAADIDNRAVPFVLGKSPELDTNAKYWHFIPSGDRIHKLTMSVTNLPASYQGLTGNINLRSGWK